MSLLVPWDKRTIVVIILISIRDSSTHPSHRQIHRWIVVVDVDVVVFADFVVAVVAAAVLVVVVLLLLFLVLLLLLLMTKLMIAIREI